MNDETRNDTPERNDVRAGDRFAYFQSTAGYAYANATAMHARPDVAVDAWGVTLADGTPGVMHLGVAKWWRRISPALAAPKERALAPGWLKLGTPEAAGHLGPLKVTCRACMQDDSALFTDGSFGYCAPCAETAGAYVDAAKPVERKLAKGWLKLPRPGRTVPPMRVEDGWECTHGFLAQERGQHYVDCPALAVYGEVGEAENGACEAHAAEMGVFADAARTFACDFGTADPEHVVESPPRPLTFDEGNPRPGKCSACPPVAGPECAALRDERLLSMEHVCHCRCHPVEARRMPSVVGEYHGTGSFTARQLKAWQAMDGRYQRPASAIEGGAGYVLTEAQLEALVRRAREGERREMTRKVGELTVATHVDGVACLKRGQVIDVLTGWTAQPDDGSAVHPAHGQRPWCAAPGEACCGASPPGGLLWGLCVKPAGHPRDEHREMHADINGRTWWRDAAQPDGTEKGNAK